MEFNTSLPLFYQVVTALKQQIADGKLLPGDKLPSEEALCASFGVSRVTVRKALSKLCELKLVERIPNKGHFVSRMGQQQEPVRSRSLFDSLTKAGIVPTSVIISMVTEAASEAQSKLFQRPIGDSIIVIVRVRYANGIPFAEETIYLPEYLFKGFNPWEMESRSRIAIMRDDFHIDIDTSYQTLEARYPTRRQADALKIPLNKPQLFIASNIADTSGRFVAHTDILFVADVVEYSFFWNE